MQKIVPATDALTGDLLALRISNRAFEILGPALPGQAPGSLFVSPGFLDLQVNGFAGVDYNTPSASMEEIARSLDVIRETGVSRLLPTVITGAKEDMVAALRNLARARRELPLGRMIAGFHVEGPHISPEDGPRGAHPLDCVRPPDFREFEAWQNATEGSIRIVTLSPHWPGAASYIESVVDTGVTVSVGHTHASNGQIQDAVSAGAVMSTHLGNGAHATLPKFPNYIWEQLAEDGLSASFIADGIHLPDQFMRAAVRAKTLSRSVLVTDASAPAGAPPGRYRLGAQEVDLTPDGRVVLAGQQRLAGSALLLNAAVAHVMRVCELDFVEAIRMVTVNPARLVGLDHDSHRILVDVHDGSVEVVAFSDP